MWGNLYTSRHILVVVSKGRDNDELLAVQIRMSLVQDLFGYRCNGRDFIEG